MFASRLKALGFLGFSLAWLAYDHYRPWVNFHSEALALSSIGLLVASQCLNINSSKAVAPRIVWAALATALIPWLQYFLGVNFFAGDALVVSLYLCGLSSTIWLGYSYAATSPGSDRALIPLFYLLWFVALVSAVIGLLQWLNLQGVLGMYVVQTDAGDRAMGNLGQPNHLATLLLMGMAALAWTFERKSIGSWGTTVGIAFMTLVLGLTQSRAGMLSALVIGIFLIWKNHVTPRRIAAKYVLIWLLAYGLMVLLLPYLNELLLLGEIRSLNPEGESPRIIIWKQILSGIAQSPWLGYGWNETSAAHAAGSLWVRGSMTFTNAHNVVLDLLVWNGIPLGLVLTGSCGYWFMSRIRGAIQSNAVYAMACLLPIVVHSMLEYPFAYSYFLLAAGLMVGVVEASYADIKTIKLKLRWVGGALTIWFVLGSYMIYEYLLIEEDFRIVRFENLRIGQTPVEYKVPDVWMLSQMGSMLKAARQQVLPQMSAEDIENLRRASSRFSYGSLSLRYALALGLNGNAVGATRQMDIIRGMYGEQYYQAAVSTLRELQYEKYPQLAQVLTP